MNPASSQTSRITFVGNCYYQSPTDGATCITFRRLLLVAPEQPYERILTVTDQTQELLKGCWVEDPSMVIVHNLGPVNPSTVQLSPEEQAASQEHHTVVLGIGNSSELYTFGEIPPGEYLPPFRLNKRVLVWSKGSVPTKIKVTAFPRQANG